MNTEIKRFAPLGLYLSLVAALVAAGLYIVQREWNLLLQISLGLVIIGLALFAALDPARVRSALTGRQARYGSNALVMTLAFIGILVVINYIIYQNPKRWDLTENQEHTLLQETMDTLKSLPQPVQAVAYYTQSNPTDQAKTLLDNYKYYGKGKFDYKFVDPNADPVNARQDNVTSDGTIVVKMGNRQEKVTYASEQDLTGALVRLMVKKQTVYFLIGHGEISSEDTGDKSFSKLKQALEGKSYTVKTLSLLTENKIPEDARAIIIAGPTKPLADSEVKLLSDYDDKGGSLIVMEEPTITTQFGDSPDPLANYLEQKWSIKLDNDIIIDLSSQQAYMVVAAEYSNTQPITSKLQGLYTAFPTARSITSGKAPAGVTLTDLIKTTSPQAGQIVTWGETDLASLKSGGQPGYEQGKDLAGPLSLAVSGENTTNKSRVVVFGDSEFAIDANFSFYGNGDLLVNSIDWVTEQESLINLTPKQSVQRTLLPPTRYTMNLILLGSVFVLPGIVLVTGIGVYIQRRRRL